MANESTTVLGLIPARGGSKGISRKNIAPLAGRPLIQYTIEAAQRSSRLTDFIVSTDDPEIAGVCRQLGARVPFLRPAELATDTATAQDVALHALSAYSTGQTFDYLLLLQPTAPFRSAEDIDAAVDLAVRHHATSVVSFAEVESYHPYYMYFAEQPASPGAPATVRRAFEYEVGMPRQAFPRAVYRNGAIYLVRTDHMRNRHSFVSDDITPYMMPSERSVNIDSERDLLYAEFLLARGDLVL